MGGFFPAEEGSALESGKSYKTYAPGVGLLVDADLKLVKHGQAGPAGKTGN